MASTTAFFISPKGVIIDVPEGKTHYDVIISDILQTKPTIFSLSRGDLLKLKSEVENEIDLEDEDLITQFVEIKLFQLLYKEGWIQVRVIGNTVNFILRVGTRLDNKSFDNIFSFMLENASLVDRKQIKLYNGLKEGATGFGAEVPVNLKINLRDEKFYDTFKSKAALSVRVVFCLNKVSYWRNLLNRKLS